MTNLTENEKNSGHHTHVHINQMQPQPKSRIAYILLGLFLLGFATANFFPIVIRIALRKTTDNINTAAANLSTIGFLGLLIGPAIDGYTSEIFSITTNTQAISIIWIILFLMFLYTISNSR